MADNPVKPPPGKTPTQGNPDNEPGRLEYDDRGNVTWQWSGGGDLLADDIRYRMPVRESLQPGTASLDEGDTFAIFDERGDMLQDARRN